LFWTAGGLWQRRFEQEISMQTLRDYVNDKSNAFVVESGLIVALIAFVIVLRVVQFAHGS
jgi:Flp pilus assembly pilin Flp